MTDHTRSALTSAALILLGLLAIAASSCATEKCSTPPGTSALDWTLDQWLTNCTAPKSAKYCAGTWNHDAAYIRCQPE